MFCALKLNAQIRFFIEPYVHGKILTANSVTSPVKNPLYSIKQKRIGRFESLYNWINIGCSIGLVSHNNKNSYFISYRSDGSNQMMIINTSYVQLYNNKYYANNNNPYVSSGVIFKNLTLNYQSHLYSNTNINKKKQNKISFLFYSGILFDTNVRKDEAFTDNEYNIPLLNLDTLNVFFENRSTGNKISPIIGIGLNYAIHSNKIEMFNFRICFNHSFVPLTYFQVNVTQKNNFQSSTQSLRMYGYGSGINVTIGKRINVITIKKKDV